MMVLNYRAISLPCILYKHEFEKVLYSHFYTHVHVNLSPYKHRFLIFRKH